MASLAASNTTNSPSMGNTNQVTREEVDELLIDIHTQQGTMCPIGQTAFKDPVNTVDGQTYERENIQRWFDGGNRTSLGTTLSDLTLTPNLEKKAQVKAIEALRPFVKRFLEHSKKLSRLEDILDDVEARERRAKQAEEERKRKEAEAAEEERKRKEEEAAAEEERRNQEAERINRQRKEAEEQRQRDMQQKYQYDVQLYKRSLGLA